MEERTSNPAELSTEGRAEDAVLSRWSVPSGISASRSCLRSAGSEDPSDWYSATDRTTWTDVYVAGARFTAVRGICGSMRGENAEGAPS